MYRPGRCTKGALIYVNVVEGVGLGAKEKPRSFTEHHGTEMLSRLVLRNIEMDWESPDCNDVTS